MGYQRICVAAALQRYLDFTPVALRQRELAGVLAKAYGAKIWVLSVDAPVPLLPDVETTEDKLRRYVGVLEEDACEVTTTTRQGRPSREIRSYVEVEIDADLLIIGSHSKRGPLDVGLGSTAAALNDLASTVLMIRPTASELERTKKLIIPRYPLVFPYG